MRKPIMLVGALLTLGCFTPAHAGHYELKPNGWTLVSKSRPARNALGTPNIPDYQSPPQPAAPQVQTTFWWKYKADNNRDLPKPAKITLNFTATTGDCFVAEEGEYNYASNYVEGGFSNRLGYDDMGAERHDGFKLSNSSRIGNVPGSTTNPSPFTIGNVDNIAEDLYEQVDVGAYTGATSYSGVVTAGATSGRLTVLPTCIVQ